MGFPILRNSSIHHLSSLSVTKHHAPSTARPCPGYPWAVRPPQPVAAQAMPPTAQQYSPSDGPPVICLSAISGESQGGE